MLYVVDAVKIMEKLTFRWHVIRALLKLGIWFMLRYLSTIAKENSKLRIAKLNSVWRPAEFQKIKYKQIYYLIIFWKELKKNVK